MANMKLKIFIGVVILAILVPRIILLVRLIIKPGKVVYNVQPGPCENIKGIEQGAEDMLTLPSGLVLLSTGLRFQKDLTVSPWKDIKGQLKLFDPSKPDLGAEPVTIEGNTLNLDKLNPHGISLWGDKDGYIVFLVNHLPNLEVIERFSYDIKRPKVLKHLESITSEAFIFPNDIVAVGPRQFYITNYQYYHGHGSIMAQVEMFGDMRWGSVAFYDGAKSRLVVEGLQLPNGIDTSPDKRLIYVVNIGTEEILVLERQENGDLKQIQAYSQLSGAIDNINVDTETGNIWAGVHPMPLQTLKNMEDPKFPSPSEILLLKTDKSGKIVEGHVMYSEDGTKYIAASTVALRYKTKMLAGSINNRAVMCDIKYMP